MPILPTNRLAGGVIQSADINAIADLINDIVDGLQALRYDALDAGVKLYFGSGTETDLFKDGAGVLRTSDQFHANWLRADENIYVDEGGVGGKIFFGSTQDVNLYRSAANTLKTDDAFTIATDKAFTVLGTLGPTVLSNGLLRIQNSGAGVAFTIEDQAVGFATKGSYAYPGGFEAWPANTTAPSFVTADWDDTQHRWRVLGGGTMEWGSGSATPDTNLYRFAANTLATDDRFAVFRVVLSDLAFTAGSPNESTVRWLMDASGKMLWGDGGVGGQDTNLFRNTADELKTDDSFVVGGSYLHLGGTSSFMAMTEVSAAPGGGTNQARLFAQDNGAGKTRLMVQMPTGAAIQLAIEP